MSIDQLSQRQLRIIIQNNFHSLCENKSSVSQICKEIGINRQQFAKYLDGRAMPSFENVIRIADYFNVSLDDLIQDAEPAFIAGLSEQNVTRTESTFAQKVESALADAQGRSSTVTMPHDGFYLSYTNVYSKFPDLHDPVNISLVKIKTEGNVVYYERRQYRPPTMGKKLGKFVHLGKGYVVVHLLDITYADISEFDSYNAICLKLKDSTSKDLRGIQLVRHNDSTYSPAASRVYWQYQGEKPNLRKLMKKCGYSERNRELADAAISKWLTEGFNENQHVLR